VDERLTLFAFVLLPLPVPKNYTYRVPHEWNDLVQIGQRVVVQFGSRKIYSGIIVDFSDTPPEKYEAAYILELMEAEPIVHPVQLRFWTWISQYYMCHPGEVMSAALPAGLRLQSETKLVINPDADLENIPELDEKEQVIFGGLQKGKELTPEEAAKLIGQKSAMRFIRSLYLKGLLMMHEEVSENYKPKLVECIQPAPEWTDEDFAKATLDKMEKRAPKQADVMTLILGLAQQEYLKSELTGKYGLDSSHIRALVQKGLLVQYKKQVDRLESLDAEPVTFHLSPAQQLAAGEIDKSIEKGRNVLLYGATGSGKTYLYIHQIKKALEKGLQALLLLPEVALTEQMVSRLSHYFGDEMGVWHNFYSGSERTELYEKVLNGTVRFVVGARSALFAPFNKLGVVVIDEEHENSFKQFEKRPHYHGRDAAIQLAHFHGCQVLAGSATPSYELYHAAQTGLWDMVRLSERFNPVPSPEIQVIHTGEARRQNIMKGPFSEHLIEGMQVCMDAGEQIIVYQNRKGYVPFISCDMCGFTAHCVNCDISLTYYKTSNKQRCTYCGYAQDPPVTCEACGSSSLTMRGYGTERLAEELTIFFPQARIARLDNESIKKRSDFQRILNGFANHDIDILVGTQLLSKGLDFSNVGLVAVPDADMLLRIPDFRCNERAFQQLFQVAGRAGRGTKQGRVLIQAAQTSSPVILALFEGGYEALAKEELSMRSNFNYPPFSRLIRFQVKHKEEQVAENAALSLYAALSPHLGPALLAPTVPSVGRVRNYYLRQLLLKIENKDKAKVARYKLLLWEKANEIIVRSGIKGVFVDFDVDPV
jgi:primosomal protein N' (replication factor Y)